MRQSDCLDAQIGLYLYCLHATKPDCMFFSMGPVLFAISLQCAIPVSKHQKRWLRSYHLFRMFI